MSFSDPVHQIQHDKLMNIASNLEICLSGKYVIVLAAKDFNQIIHSECNAEVFPLTKAEALACGCELDAMTPQQILAMLSNQEDLVERN